MGFLDKAKTASSTELVVDEKVASESQKNIPPKQPKVLTKQEQELKDQVDQEIREQLEKLVLGDPLFTPVDAIVNFLEEHNKKSTIDEIAKGTNLRVIDVERYCRILQKQKVISIAYPLLFTMSPKVELLVVDHTPNKELELGNEKKLLEKYTINADYVVADIQVWSVPFENTPIYQIVPHKMSVAVEKFLENLIEQLSLRVPTDVEVGANLESVMAMKQIFFQKAKELIEEHFPDIGSEYVHMLSGSLLHRSFGLGDLEVLMSDNWLEEIAINGDKVPVSVYHKKYGWIKSTKYFAKESEIYNIASQIGRKVGKQINALSPIMDAQMQSGDRVAATLFPISTQGDTLTIRRFSRNPWTVVHMMDPKNHTLSKEVLAFLWLAVQYELNMLVVGGTASGKTSVLNTLSSLIPPTNRIISIEDTREISLPSALHWNWVPMASKTANSEGQGEVSMLDLMVASLRMRPDRIIVGEIRRKQQAEAMFEAMHTGHSVSATMHADTAEQIKHRLTQPPINIPENELQALQLIVVQYRDRRRGLRRTLEVAELLPGGADEKINLNYLYRWRPRSDKFVKDEQSIRVIEDLNLHTGMTQREVEKNITEKEEVLQWLLDNRIYDIDKIGHIMRIYYKFPQLLMDTVHDEGKLNDVL